MRTRPTVLYRLWDAEGRLLYVGISASWTKRMSQHAGSQPWWDDVASVTLERFPDGVTASWEERRAIRFEGPLYNVAEKKWAGLKA